MIIKIIQTRNTSDYLSDCLLLIFHLTISIQKSLFSNKRSFNYGIIKEMILLMVIIKL